MEIRKLTPCIGAEITGVDLGALTSHEIESIKRAFAENLVIFFRDQVISPDQHKNFGRLFGELYTHPTAPSRVDGHPEILMIYADENSTRIDGENWHSDVSCDLIPPMGSILYMKEVPPSGGDTLFASMYAVYESLSDHMKKFLHKLTAVHDGDQQYGSRYKAEVSPCNEHPVIFTHPVTKKNAVFVNPIFTKRIVQLSVDESNALLQFLFAQVTRPEFQCRFQWRANSVAFWDNRCAQHQAIWDYYPNRRFGHRITVVGDRPTYRFDLAEAQATPSNHSDDGRIRTEKAELET